MTVSYTGHRELRENDLLRKGVQWRSLGEPIDRLTTAPTPSGNSIASTGALASFLDILGADMVLYAGNFDRCETKLGMVVTFEAVLVDDW